MFFKQFCFFIFVLSISCTSLDKKTLQAENIFSLKTLGVHLYRDSYHNFHIKITSALSSEFIKKAAILLKKNHPKTALYIHQPPQIGIDMLVLKQMGFDFAEYDYKNEEFLWILDNNRGVTHFGSTTTGAGIVVKDSAGKILIILNPDFNTWVLPSGGTDRGELIRIGAIRELREEVGLIGNPDDLRLMMMTNSLNVTKQKKMNSINFFFLLEKFQGKAIKSDEAPET